MGGSWQGLQLLQQHLAQGRTAQQGGRNLSEAGCERLGEAVGRQSQRQNSTLMRQERQGNQFSTCRPGPWGGGVGIQMQAWGLPTSKGPDFLTLGW
jgi:hypothetical protein